MTGRLQDQVAIVTGGSRGIGLAICRAFAREGARLVIAARQMAGVDAAAQELRDAGAVVEALTADVTDPRSVEALVRRTLERFGAIDILVNNAGAHKAARFQDYSLDDWKYVVEVNLHGTFVCTQAVLPHMIAAGHGKIVNMASTAAKWGSLYQSAYNASKHAVLGLTRCLALETAQQGINVNAICPGFVETEMADTLLADFGAIMGRTAAEVEAALKARVPQGRFLRPEEVADLAVYLASHESDAMTGVGVTLAGGMVLI